MIARLLSTLFFACLLSACGFTPVHSPSVGKGSAFKNLRIEAVPTRSPEDKAAGFFLTQRLRDRVGDQTGKHILRLRPRASQRRLGLSGDDIASRYDVSLRVSYELIEAGTGKTLDRGRVQGTTSFGAPVDPYGLQAAESNALEIIASDVADRLLVKLAGYYAKDAQKPEK